MNPEYGTLGGRGLELPGCLGGAFGIASHPRGHPGAVWDLRDDSSLWEDEAGSCRCVAIKAVFHMAMAALCRGWGAGVSQLVDAVTEQPSQLKVGG